MDKQPNDQDFSGPVAGQPDPVASRIKAIRQKKGISQTDFAQKIGIERSNYHRLENRGGKLTLEQLERIAQALDVSIVQIVSDEMAAGIEQARLIQSLQSQLADKQVIIEGFANSRESIAQQIESSLVRTAQAIRLDQLDPDNGMGSLMIVQQAVPSLANFPDRSEQCTLFNQSYTGLQLAYLALHMSISEANLFSLIIRLIDLQLLNRSHLYVRAFLYVGQTSAIYDGVLEEIIVARRKQQGRKNL